MPTTSSTTVPSGNATRRFADPDCLSGTRLWYDQVVPSVRFVDASSGEVARTVDFRNRRALVLAFVHDRCAECAAWAQATVDAVAGRSDAEIRLVAPRVGPAEDTSRLWIDRDDRRERFLTDPDAPALLVLDRYAAVQEASVADDHRLPSPGEVLATLTHIDIHCAECSV